MEWTNFICKGDHLYNYSGGDIRRDEWNKTTAHSPGKFNPFLPLDNVVASRFVLAFTASLDVAFIPLDNHKLVLDPLHMTSTDLGDDVLHYLNGAPTRDMDGECLLHPNMKAFLKEAL